MINTVLTRKQVVIVSSFDSKSGWSFPMGKRNRDETNLQCAIREVRRFCFLCLVLLLFFESRTFCARQLRPSTKSLLPCAPACITCPSACPSVCLPEFLTNILLCGPPARLFLCLPVEFALTKPSIAGWACVLVSLWGFCVRLRFSLSLHRSPLACLYVSLSVCIMCLSP